ncbi:hypothetical protein AB0903_08185 [Streptomyces sp. NPDC048389]|uniref:hypothetical protein n=1 Tax=Streptomyces sp. NPDC048389 TaxID=3154622 RepID=UPI0034536242
MTHPTPDHEQQPRIPGVRYRKVTRHRVETTTINGHPEMEEVPYTAWEPVPPRDWDGMVIRGVTIGAVGVTLLATTSTAASIGGLLDKTVPAPVAYSAAVVFTVPWLACQGVEYVLRREPDRARKARIAGWFLLLISMATVVAYGIDKGEPVAGAAGAAVDLMSKGMWVLVLSLHAVPLSAGVANWLRRRKEKITANAVVANEIRRLDQHEAYMRAVFPTFPAAEAITTVVESPALQGGAPLSGMVSGPVPVVSAPVSGQVPTPASAAAPVVPPVSVPVPVPAPAPAPAPVPAAAPVVPPATVPAPPVPPAAEAPVPPAPPVEPPATDTARPPLRAVGGPFKSDTIAAALAANPQISDEDLIRLVDASHGVDPKNVQTVPRTRRRIEDRLRKKKAS